MGTECKTTYLMQHSVLQGHMYIQGHTVNTLEGLPKGGKAMGVGIKNKGKIIIFLKERPLHSQVMVLSHKQKNIIILNIVHLKSKRDNKNSGSGKHLAG